MVKFKMSDLGKLSYFLGIVGLVHYTILEPVTTKWSRVWLGLFIIHASSSKDSSARLRGIELDVRTMHEPSNSISFWDAWFFTWRMTLNPHSHTHTRFFFKKSARAWNLVKLLILQLFIILYWFMSCLPAGTHNGQTYCEDNVSFLQDGWYHWWRCFM